MSFLIIRSIRLSSSLVLFKTGTKYLTRETAQIRISLTRFLLNSFVSSNFLILLRYSFLIFFLYLHLFDSVNFQYPQIFLVSFSPSVLDIVVWLLSCVIYHFSFLAFFYAKFHSYILTVYLTVCIRVSNSSLFLAKSLMSSMYIKWLIFSYDLLSVYPAVHFLTMCLSGIMPITNSNGDSASPWNIPLCIFPYVKLFPPAVNSTSQVCMVFSINCTTWSGILWIRMIFSLVICSSI